jgi:hypothetical protein
MPCLQPYGEYGGQAAVAIPEMVNSAITNSFFMAYSLKWHIIITDAR